MAAKIEKLAIANRGEVAVRIIRACQELGISTVLLHSDVDMNTVAYRLADERVCIGPAPTNQSYLNIQANIDGAKASGADAIHPGFGFLSENADFAEACAKNRITFVGPSPESIRLFGDKISAKKLVESAGAPTIPGYQGEQQSVEALIQEIEKIGYPVIVKAAAGGGGRGLKVVRALGEAKGAIESAQREGLAAFGSAQVFLEKYLDKAKHIEVQIFGDADGKVFHLGERECSVQRRHQKVVEEALSASLTPELRQAICDTAVMVAKKARYLGAGTVEFLLQDGRFYFMEMNTRLQVEHPVTEMVMGVDLVKAQIQVAQGKSVLWEQDRLTPRGHAIECRIYAENPFQNGMPSTGVLGSCHWPQGPGRRFEIGFEPGDEITANYDSMIAKAIVWDESRPRAIEKMVRTLQDTVIFGLRTNIPYLIEILQHPEFMTSTMTTKFIEENFASGLTEEFTTDQDRQLAELLATQLVATGNEVASALPSPWLGSWGTR